MKRAMKMLMFTVVLISVIGMMNHMAYAQSEDQNENSVTHGRRFVDENNDGYNDNAPDHDGDGIPNGMDDDYTRSATGSGRGFRGFVDIDGDGINDRAQDYDGDGIPNGQDPDYTRPQDGSGRKLGRGGRGMNSGFGRWHTADFVGGRGRGIKGGICNGTGSRGIGRGGKR